MMRLVRGNNGEGREVIDYAQGRISSLQSQLQAVGLPERESDVVRGRIAELQKLIDLVNTAGEENVY
jgi:hypothetical protein